MRKKFSNFNFQFPKGFTLIELLVVIAIIGVLSALLMVNFIGIRQRARDATRKSDLRQIQSALELYRSDQGVYPTGLSPCASAMTGGTTTYLQKIPCDPLGGSYQICMFGAGTQYQLRSCLENTSDSQADPTPNPAGPGGCTGGGAITACASTTTSFTLQNP